jgi:hypothetical protein
MTRLRVLVACEFSGVFRRAFRALGHDAWSCDLLPPEDGSEFHIQDDALKIVCLPWWDVLIAHPVCKYLANSGAKHLYIGMKAANGPSEERWEEMRKGAEFYNRFRNCDIAKKAIENPIMHGHARDLCGEVTQYVQPWWFGEPFFKATGWYLEGLPNLVSTNRLTPPKPGTPEHKQWSAVHRMPPGPNRGHERSRSFTGMAEAAATQWGSQ